LNFFTPRQGFVLASRKFHAWLINMTEEHQVSWPDKVCFRSMVVHIVRSTEMTFVVQSRNNKYVHTALYSWSCWPCRKRFSHKRSANTLTEKIADCILYSLVLANSQLGIILLCSASSGKRP
jgi:hypothetical protein